MNFAERFDAKLSHDSPVSIGGERFSFESRPGFVQHQDSSKNVIVPDAHLLFSGDYIRIGYDLIISGQDQKFVVGNYFKGESRPSLSSKDGATLSGHIIDAMTGHVHYAQAVAPAASEVIGHVLKLSGSATAIRNGVSIELHIGDAVQKGDVIQTGADSSIGMTFVDGSAFGMTSNARMVLNEMIFDPNGSSNSSLISLVQGTITFVAGQTAKNGNMRVETPVATMGIRGTAVLVEIAAEDGPTKFSVLVEPDGHTGSYNLYDKVNGQLIGTVSQAGQVTFVSSLGLGQPPSAIEQLKTMQDQQTEKAIIQQVFQLYFPNYNPDSNPNSTKHGSSSGNNLSEIIIGTATLNGQTSITQIELRFVPADPNVGGSGTTDRVFYNTKASFSADAVKSTQSFITTDKTFKIADVVHIDDPDIGNAPFYDIPTPFVAGSAVIKSAVSTIPFVDDAYLKPLLHIDQDTGVVSFDRLKFNFLAEGETATFEIEVTAQSGPDSARVVIPVTITGTNDAPTIVAGSSVVLGGVTEDVGVVSSALATNGVITFQDVDLTDTHTATVALTSTSSSLPGFVANNTNIGTFTIDPVSENNTDTADTGTVAWHFTLPDDNPVLQSLSVGQTITQTYTITVRDEHGVEVPQIVTVTITGTNDAPVLAADVSTPHLADEVFNTTNSTVEDTATGSLTFADIDLSDTHQVSTALNAGPNSVTWSGGSTSGIPASTLAALASAMTATLSDSTGTGSGSVTWNFKIPDHFLDFLADNETLTLVYDITVKDYYNGVWTGTYSTQQVSVLISAANDRPVITSIDTVVAVQEDVNVATGDVLKSTGSVTFADTDLTDTHTAHAIYNNDAAAHNGAFISTALATALAAALTVPSSALAADTNTFDWNFVLDNKLVQYLAEGETITLSYTVAIQDNSGVSANDTSATKVVYITITGTNDAPVVAAALTAAANEGDVSFTKDLLAGASDVDHGDVLHVANLSYTVDGNPSVGIPAGLVLDADGHTLTIDPKSPAFDALAEGEQTTIVVSYDVTDSHNAVVHQTETITITGTNDAPTIVADTPVHLVEATSNDGGTLTAVANLTIGDVDGTVNYHSDALLANGWTYDNANDTYTKAGSYGTATLDAAHHLTYTLDNGLADGLTSSDHPVETFRVPVIDDHNATAFIDVAFTVDGANDAPAANADNLIVASDAFDTSGTPSLSISDALLLLNDTDAEGNALAVTDHVENGTNGTVMHDSAEVVYSIENLPVPGSQVLDSFKYEATDGTDSSGLATVNLTIVGADATDPTHHTLVGTTADETFIGGPGADTFVFATGFSHDVIKNFDLDSDAIQINGITQSILDLYSHATEANGGGDALITPDSGHPADTIVLKGITVQQLHDHIMV